MVVAGCSGRQPPTLDDAAFDNERARETLVAALDAWRQGRTRDLARRNPPIRFADDDLARGARLVGYEIVEPAAPARPFKPTLVLLDLRDPQGKTARKTASYHVALTPGLAVLRGDP
ncbi:MAG: hypothetical protein HYX69_12735 [Planctomycetia bacterium]|nr:hypothetical protein [Planctomycetia bacterium]